MKKIVIAAAVIFFISILAVSAHAELDSFLGRLNVQAKADMNGFSIQLSTQFNVPVPQVQAIIKSVDAPADAFMVLQLGQMAKRPPETVVQTYKGNKGKGWGVIAKQLGIKPGSAEFHALKRGDFDLTGEPGGGGDKGQGTGKGKGRGHNK
jgi:hypothetical protein